MVLKMNFEGDLGLAAAPPLEDVGRGARAFITKDAIHKSMKLQFLLFISYLIHRLV